MKRILRNVLFCYNYPVKKDIWVEGKWVDFWTINHILIGLCLGPILFMMNVPLPWSFAIASILFFGWEVIELRFKVEHFTNQVADIFANYLGYGIFYVFYYLLGTPLGVGAVALLSFSFLALNLSGFLAWRARVKTSEI